VSKYWILSVFLFLLLPAIHGQEKYFSGVSTPAGGPRLTDPVTKIAQTIQRDELKEILQYLASDSCKGRELGSPGNDSAAEYIASRFRSYGISAPPGMKDHFQAVSFKWVYWKKMNFKIDDFEYRNLWDYISLARDNQNLTLETDEVLFLGYGIDDPAYSDYKNQDVSGKVILIYKGEPAGKNGISHLTGKKELSEWSTDLTLKLRAAHRKGVKLVLIVEDKFKELGDAKRMDILSPSVLLAKDEDSRPPQANSIYLSSTLVSKLLGPYTKKVIQARDKIRSKGKPKAVLIKRKISLEQQRDANQVKGRNVLAYIEGTDKKDELVVITAHYDHIGMRGKEVFNGADDNASGTSSVIQIAKALQAAKEAGLGPRRSVLCMLVTGEEKGLLGSMYYVNDPVIPLKNTMVNINVDMVGRTDTKYKDKTDYIYVIGSDRLSKDLHRIHEEVNLGRSGLTLDYTYNSESDPNRYYYRSDHYNFAEKGIPAIFFFSGVHEDYHRITDDADKILYDKTEKVARHIFYLAWELANANDRLKVDQGSR
jgi:hypothetical protein